MGRLWKQYKYLGTVVDENLTFTNNVDHIYKTAHKRMFLLRKLRSFNFSTEVLQLVYRSLIESVLSFNLVSWYGNVFVKNKARLARVVNQAGKIVGIKQLQLYDLYQLALRRKAVQIYHDSTHPLNSTFETLPSDRRPRMPWHAKTVTRDLLFRQL